MSSPPEFDVAVVGASVAGCTAARLFAQRGASVALIERRHDPAAYKVVCTHAILLGWEGPDAGLGSRVAPLRDRLPPDLRDTPGPVFDALPFSSLYLLDDEFAAETANRTVHGAIHLGWVPDGAGGYHGQMAILVKRNGLLGAAYMAAIAPFRHLLVYPPALRELGQAWRRAGA